VNTTLARYIPFVKKRRPWYTKTFSDGNHWTWITLGGVGLSAGLLYWFDRKRGRAGRSFDSRGATDADSGSGRAFSRSYVLSSPGSETSAGAVPPVTDAMAGARESAWHDETGRGSGASRSGEPVGSASASPARSDAISSVSATKLDSPSPSRRNVPSSSTPEVDDDTFQEDDSTLPADARTCGNSVCSCKVTGDAEYCSPACRGVSEGGVTAIACECGHSGCGGEITTPSA
jgi:hypothetical protein